ncbi:MAG: hypothetical protein P8Z74_18340 [Acidobacteriota bacterium]
MSNTRRLSKIRAACVLLPGILCCFQAAQLALAQSNSELFLVSGYPSGDPDIHVPTHVYTLSRETQTLTDVVGLVPAAAQTAFVRVYQDLRLLIVATPHYRPEQVSIVSMDKPCEFRTVTLNYSGSFQPLGCYLLDTPHDGLCLALESISLQTRRRLHLVFGLLNGEKKELGAESLRFARLPGSPGLGITDPYQMEYLMVDPGGSLELPWWNETDKRLIDMDWPRLPHLSRALTSRKGRWPVGESKQQAMGLATWLISTSKLDLVWVRGESGSRPQLIYRLLDKSKKTWSDVLVPGHEPDALTQLRPFGDWLAGTPVGSKVTEIPRELVDRVRAERREEDHEYQRLLLSNPRKELFLYDVERGQGFTVDTGDIESVVLLIENDVVYYRVKDRLYQSEIRGGRVEPPELLAQDPALTGVYWAFMGPACQVAEAQGEE